MRRWLANAGRAGHVAAASPSAKREQALRCEAHRLEQRTLCLDLGDRHATLQVCPDIVGLRRRGIVHVAADIEVVVVVAQLLLSPNSCTLTARAYAGTFSKRSKVETIFSTCSGLR
ncbi:MAG: hypothetical protein AW12_01251 [Candidatus Accumulibacter sp. BA-94]|nr:MAG: hypothetical protein AW12_01251 [Candidatus Accumulibacter sp. BA-94]